MRDKAVEKELSRNPAGVRAGGRVPISFLFLASCLLVSPLPGRSRAGLPAGAGGKIAAILERGRRERGIPGLSAAVLWRGKVLWKKAFGLADVENGVPVTTRTVFRIASISKSLTATALLRLFEKGRIDLDADIRRYVPSFPKKRWTVTPRLLLGHLAGIRHYRRGEIYLVRRFTDLASTLPLFARDPLLFEPGTKYSYSTYGFSLLGRAVETASGKAFFDALWDLVLAPAGMFRTFLDDQQAIVSFRARGYRRDGKGRLLNCRLADTSNKVPGGGLLSTAEDLARFGGALLGGKLLSPGTRKLAWTSQKTRDGKRTGYGLGFQVRTWKGRKEVDHTGGQPGTSTILYILPREGTVLVLLSNLEGRNLRGLARKAVQVLHPLAGGPSSRSL